jgi:hypothetical protein
LNYNLYGHGVVGGSEEVKLTLGQTGHLIFAEASRRLMWEVFVGARFLDRESFLTVRPNNGNIPPIPTDVGIHTTLKALGLRILRDTRPNDFYPTAGDLTKKRIWSHPIGPSHKYSRQMPYRVVADPFATGAVNGGAVSCAAAATVADNQCR